MDYFKGPKRSWKIETKIAWARNVASLAHESLSFGLNNLQAHEKFEDDTGSIYSNLSFQLFH